jgi:hypothetical protein
MIYAALRDDFRAPQRTFFHKTFLGDHFDSFNKNIQAYVHNSHKICNIRASLDTQADENVMAERIAKRLGYQIDTSQTTTFEDIGKSTVRSIGKVSLSFRLVDFDEWWTETFHMLGKAFISIRLTSIFVQD